MFAGRQGVLPAGWGLGQEGPAGAEGTPPGRTEGAGAGTGRGASRGGAAGGRGERRGCRAAETSGGGAWRSGCRGEGVSGGRERCGSRAGWAGAGGGGGCSGPALLPALQRSALPAPARGDPRPGSGFHPGPPGGEPGPPGLPCSVVLGGFRGPEPRVWRRDPPRRSAARSGGVRADLRPAEPGLPAGSAALPPLLLLALVSEGGVPARPAQQNLCQIPGEIALKLGHLWHLRRLRSRGGFTAWRLPSELELRRVSVCLWVCGFCLL